MVTRILAAGVEVRVHIVCKRYFFDKDAIMPRLSLLLVLTSFLTLFINLREPSNSRAMGGEATEVVDLDVGRGVKLKLVRIPAKGKTFWMGSPKTEKERIPFKDVFMEDFDAEEQHEVEFSRDFYIGMTEVTQEQYRMVMGSNPSYIGKEGNGKKKIAGLKTDEFPVENVTWKQAKEFCEKLGTKMKDGQQYRLPTEAEWEYSCRGGRSAKKSSPFYLKKGPSFSLSGGQINFDGNFPYNEGVKGNYLERTSPCGSFAESVNEFGLRDMHGNVWEWCEDWYAQYPTERLTDPTGPLKGSERVIRGGGWTSIGSNCRAAFRGKAAPSVRLSTIGFRLARISSNRAEK